MRLKNIVIVVEDMERSIAFYKELFGLDVVRRFEGNIILMEGLVLQDKATWEKLIRKQGSFGDTAGETMDIIEATGTTTSLGSCYSELYFETGDLEAFQQKLDDSGLAIKYLCRLTTYEWGQKAIRLYDPDGHLIEVGALMI